MANSKSWRYLAVSLIALVTVVGAACTPAASTPIPLASPFGRMALYESAKHPFSIQYPAEWTEHPNIQDSYGIPVWRTNSKGEWFVVVDDVTTHGESLRAYVDWVISVDAKTDAEHKMVSREQVQTANGPPAELLEYTISWSGEPMTVNAFIYLHDNKIGFRAAYGVYTSRYEEMKDMIAYSLGTFRCDKRVDTPITCNIDKANLSR